MGRKKKKKATQRKEISQKAYAAENEEDESGTDCCSCNSLPCACNVEDREKESESNDWDQFKRKESIYKDMISRMNGQIEIYQILQDEVTNRSERLEA